MVLAYMLAVAIDRSREAIASLALAAIVICFALPGSTADIGFQLSFASVIAIVLGMRRVGAWFARRKRVGMLAGEPSLPRWRFIEAPTGYLAVSFWAMVGTAPLTAYHFNQFAIVGIVANALVVPIMAFGATVSGLIAAALSFFSESAARPILLFGASALAAGNWLAAWFVDWPLAWFRIFTPTILELAIAYLFLTIWLLAPLAVAIDPKRSLEEVPDDTASAHKLGWRARCAIALTIALTIDAAYWTYDRFLNPDLRVTFLSVGEGDGAVVRFPGSRVMVIDGGGSYGGFDAGERIVAPYLWSQKIMHVDYIALSHPDLDHFGGLDFIAMNFARARSGPPECRASTSATHAGWTIWRARKFRWSRCARPRRSRRLAVLRSRRSTEPLVSRRRRTTARWCCDSTWAARHCCSPAMSSRSPSMRCSRTAPICTRRFSRCRITAARAPRRRHSLQRCIRRLR
jgi:competence protein ComEC